MPQTSREIVTRTLKFQSPERLPRDIWCLPWAWQNLGESMKEIYARWPGDFGGASNSGFRPAKRVSGTSYDAGTSTDAWGCVFENLQAGIHGEVKNPIVTDLKNWRSVVHAPVEIFPENLDASRDAVNREYAASDKFFFASSNPRPWEQYQFLRGTENAMMDIMDPDENSLGILKTLHDFYLREFEFWAKTDVDALRIMDDWGSQRSLLIPPAIWREIFKPMYKEYADIAHAHGKSIFMHSDGYIQEIYPDLVEIGIDALNSQLFVMDMPRLAECAKGKMTFWGEIDRQHVLTATNPQVGRDAVRKVAKHFYDPAGGVIVNFEAGLGSHPATLFAICEEWDEVQREITN